MNTEIKTLKDTQEDEVAKVRNEELSLIQEIVKWPKILEESVNHQEPHRITYYLQSLASVFHSLWNYGKNRF